MLSNIRQAAAAEFVEQLGYRAFTLRGSRTRHVAHLVQDCLAMG